MNCFNKVQKINGFFFHAVVVYLYCSFPVINILKLTLHIQKNGCHGSQIKEQQDNFHCDLLSTIKSLSARN